MGEVIVCIVLFMCVVGLYFVFKNDSKVSKTIDTFSNPSIDKENLHQKLISIVSNIEQHGSKYKKGFLVVEVINQASVSYLGSTLTIKDGVFVRDYWFDNPKTVSLLDITNIIDIILTGDKVNHLLDFKSKTEWCTDGINWYSIETYTGGCTRVYERMDAKIIVDEVAEVINCETLKCVFVDDFYFKVGVLKECQNPKNEYWERFLEKEMLDKQKRDQEMKDWVDVIIIKHQKYNDLQYKYECLPSAPIDDIDGFKSFCRLVHERIKYEEYEISNYLMLKVGEKRKS